MALEQSILKSVKKVLGLSPSYSAFDQDVMMHINAAFFTMNQAGLGPADGYLIEGEEEKWEEFLPETDNKSIIGAIKSYVYLHVRLLFDPPETTHHLTAMEKQKEELIHRLIVEREVLLWPRSPSSLYPR